MSRRTKLHIDKMVHINDLTIDVYRSLDANVTATGSKIMDIFEPSAIKTTLTQEMEVLQRDSITPYIFYAKRHFDEVPLPRVFVGSSEVDARDLVFFSDEKMIEIHNGDLGLNDGRIVYMTYDYQSMGIMDDKETQSGVAYIGPPATGLRPPFNLILEQDFITNRIRIAYSEDRNPVVFYYRLRARDSDGNQSAYSATHSTQLLPEDNDIFYRIERSRTGSVWEPVSLSNMLEWHDEVKVIESPDNVRNVEIVPMNSKEIGVMLDNPWYWWNETIRTGYGYRVRAEDREGEATEWVYIDPITLRVKPKSVLIRRKEDNGAPSTPTGNDAVDVFYLTEDRIDVNDPILRLVDDQLSEALKYGYTFFLTDDLDMTATPAYYIGDLTPWANILLFRNQKKTDKIRTADFIMAFELADRIIEIGV